MYELLRLSGLTSPAPEGVAGGGIYRLGPNSRHLTQLTVPTGPG